MTREDIDMHNKLHKLYSENVELRKNYFCLLESARTTIKKLRAEIEELKALKK